MTFRFRHRLKILPGVHLNVGKRGVSTSIGVRGASVTVGKQTRVSVGLPGTGLSHTTLVGGRKSTDPDGDADDDAPAAAAAARNSTATDEVAGSPVYTFFCIAAVLGVVGYAVLSAVLPEGTNRTVCVVAWACCCSWLGWKVAASGARRRKADR